MSEQNLPGADKGARLSNPLFFALKLLAAVAIFAMALLTFFDVVGRYVFAAPIQGTFEIVGLLLGVVTFSSLPLISHARAHITVDLFDRFIVGRFRWVQQFLVLIGSAIVVAFFAERLFSAGLDEAAANYVTEDLGLSRAPLLYGLSGLSAISAIILLLMVWQMATGKLAVTPPHGLADDDEAVADDPADKPLH